MAMTNGWLPPSREHWELLVTCFSIFPVFTAILWLRDWILMGKNSTSSRYNIPGRIGWATMEAPGFISLLVTMTAVQKSEGLESLPKANWLMAMLYTTHYVYRSIISPLFLAPSMSPMHVTVWASALFFQTTNGACIGGWLGGYGPRTAADWAERMPYVQVGLVIFLLGFVGNIYHDDELRELRRQAAREQEEKKGKGAVDTQKVYKLPQAALFRYILYPHYFCEWVEWVGFWIIGGSGCIPARNFVANELAAMTPQAVSGRKWYLEKFGEEKVGNRKAVIPGLL